MAVWIYGREVLDASPDDDILWMVNQGYSLVLCQGYDFKAWNAALRAVFPWGYYMKWGMERGTSTLDGHVVPDFHIPDLDEE